MKITELVRIPQENIDCALDFAFTELAEIGKGQSSQQRQRWLILFETIYRMAYTEGYHHREGDEILKGITISK